MHDIFLSYATKDRERLKPLVEALEAQGWSVFRDHRSIKVAQDWHDVIGTAIQQCPCVIVAWSEQSVTSRWVREEALIARDRGVLYPVLLDRVAPPFGFTLMQAADFTGWNGKVSHPEFVELREQLSIRLHATVSEPPGMSKTSGSVLKPLGILALLALWVWVVILQCRKCNSRNQRRWQSRFLYNHQRR